AAAGFDRRRAGTVRGPESPLFWGLRSGLGDSEGSSREPRQPGHRADRLMAYDFSIKCIDSSVVPGVSAGLVQADGAHQHLGDAVGVAVGGRPPVLQVAAAVIAALPRDADGAAALKSSMLEVSCSPVSRLLLSAPPWRVVGADVGGVPLAEPLDALDDGLHALGWRICSVLKFVCARRRSSRPASASGRRRRRRRSPRRPGAAGSGRAIGPVVRLHHVPAVDIAGPDPGVVGTLRPGKAVLGPAERVPVGVQHGVLLLDAEPGLELLGLLHHLLAGAPLVAGSGSPSWPQVSHSTSLLEPPRNGSLNSATGCSMTSEFWPSAWPVLEPSKFQMGSLNCSPLGSFGTVSTVRVLARRFSPVLSIQMYMHCTLSSAAAAGPGTSVDLPIWNFDGSSTGQARARTLTSCCTRGAVQRPRSAAAPTSWAVRDLRPRRRAAAQQQAAHLPEQVMEQPRSSSPGSASRAGVHHAGHRRGTRSAGPRTAFPGPQGPYYTGVGARNVYGRDVVESHYRACMYAGVKIAAPMLRSMPAQWEFQVGSLRRHRTWATTYGSRPSCCTGVREDFGVAVLPPSTRSRGMKAASIEGMRELGQAHADPPTSAPTTRRRRRHKRRLHGLARRPRSIDGTSADRRGARAAAPSACPRQCSANDGCGYCWRTRRPRPPTRDGVLTYWPFDRDAGGAPSA
uniref:Protein kinase domain-containing protein n=1 Tax=Macrostomum lignano TaxID=282301 RepID=A0A1I8FN22_9PLAT